MFQQIQLDHVVDRLTFQIHVECFSERPGNSVYGGRHAVELPSPVDFSSPSLPSHLDAQSVLTDSGNQNNTYMVVLR